VLFLYINALNYLTRNSKLVPVFLLKQAIVLLLPVAAKVEQQHG
jgi:hypothetical protein